MVRWPRDVFDILFNQHVSERGRAALSSSMFSHFLQSGVYSQLFLGFKAALRVHCRLRRQHCDTPLVRARVCLRFFLCPSPSSRRVPTWRVRGHAVAPSLVLYLQVHKALRIIPDFVFGVTVWSRLKRWKALVGILFSNRAGLKVHLIYT